MPDDTTPKPFAPFAVALDYQTRALWLAARGSGVGSSDAPAILGVSPFASALDVFAAKLGLAEPDAESEAMEWGRRLEPLVAEKYAEVTGRLLLDLGRFTIVRPAARPWQLATLDRVIAEPEAARGVLEVKTTGWRETMEDGEAPEPYLVQLQHQLAVTGGALGSLAILVAGQRFAWLDVPRHDRFIALLIEREEEFWARVQRLDPPPPTARDHRTLAMLYPREALGGEPVALPVAALEWDRVRAEALAAMSAAEAAKLEAEAQIKLALKDATVGVLPDGSGKYQWKTQQRPEHVVPAWTGRVLRRLKAEGRR